MNVSLHFRGCFVCMAMSNISISTLVEVRIWVNNAHSFVVKRCHASTSTASSSLERMSVPISAL